MTEFRSQLEDMMLAEELLFEATPGFGPVYKKFLGHSIAHPAKMNTKLTEFLIEKFTREGDVVLDPMAGSGQTGVISALRGRNAVCVDIEEKFFKWMEKARKKVERQKTLTKKGKIRNVCGDSRNLNKLLEKVDVVVTSPPYAEENRYQMYNGPRATNRKGDDSKTRVKKDYEKSENPHNIGALPFADAIVTSPPYSESMTKKRKGYTTHKNLSKTRHMGEDTKDNNIANLPHGEVDAVITSPPYSNGFKHNPQDKEKRLQRLIEIDKKGVEKGQKWGITSRAALERRLAKQDDGYGESKDNIGNLPLGKVDAVITSPPYAESIRTETDADKRLERLKREGYLNKKDWKRPNTIKTPGRSAQFSKNLYSRNKENIGNLPFADAVITSPPYERTACAERHWGKQEKYEKMKIIREKNLKISLGYSREPENIGNLKKETYLEAMLKVYMEMYKVLKPDGKAIIIIKPFIRNKKVVDLPYHTWLLLKKTGFKLSKLFKLRLKTQSFWRVLYHKKYPKVQQIQHEYIIVCKK